MSGELLLDPQIRSLVVIPIVMITLMMLTGKHYVQRLMSRKTSTIVQIGENQVLQRSRMLRANGRFLPVKAFSMRQQYLVADEDGYLIKKKRTEPPQNPMMDPANMNQMMMGNVTNMVPMFVVGGIINSVFAGFVTIRVPFPLTLRFRGMLQRGIELSTLGSSWVSSASFYFICVFGLRSIIHLVLGSNPDFDEMRMMQQQMGAGAGAPQDPGKAFDAEKENQKITSHSWAIADIEQEFLDTDVPTAKNKNQ